MTGGQHLGDDTMAKPDETATSAEINRPTPAGSGSDAKGASAPEHRTVAPSGSDAKGGSDAKSERSVMEAARERAAGEAHRAQETAAQRTDETAEQVRDAGRSFDEDSFARHATDRVADQLGQAARSMRDADLGTVADDLTDFARRQPLLFFGGAAILGFAAARMLKASERAEATPAPDYARRDPAEPYASDPWGAV
jgi:hypothetical protein